MSECGESRSERVARWADKARGQALVSSDREHVSENIIGMKSTCEDEREWRDEWEEWDEWEVVE